MTWLTFVGYFNSTVFPVKIKMPGPLFFKQHTSFRLDSTMKIQLLFKYSCPNMAH